MSAWDAYLDTLKTKGADFGAIYGADGNKWTSHQEIPLIPAETVVDIFNTIKNQDQSKMATKLNVAGAEFVRLRLDPDSMKVKRKDNGAYCFAKTNGALVVARTVEGGQAGNGAEAAHFVKEYLVSQGY